MNLILFKNKMFSIVILIKRMSEIIDTIKKTNEYKAMLAERARINYNIRKTEGRQPTAPIPKEEQKKRGPKPKSKKEPVKKAPIKKENPQTRGRKPVIIEEVSEIPSYLIKLTNNNKIDDMIRRFNERQIKMTSQERDEQTDTANKMAGEYLDNEVEFGRRTDINDKNYIELSSYDDIENNVISDTYGILTKDSHVMNHYHLYSYIKNRNILYIEMTGEDKLNEMANPIIKFNIKNRSFVASRINEDNLSTWDKEDIIENLKRITIFD